MFADPWSHPNSFNYKGDFLDTNARKTRVRINKDCPKQKLIGNWLNIIKT